MTNDLVSTVSVAQRRKDLSARVADCNRMIECHQAGIRLNQERIAEAHAELERLEHERDSEVTT